MNEIIEFKKVETALLMIKEKHEATIVDVTTKDGMLEAKANRKELRDLRISLENARKKEKEEALQYGRFVDSEAKRINEVIVPFEMKYDVEIKKEETRIENEKLAKLKAIEEEIERKKQEEIEKQRKELEEKLRIEQEARAELEAKLKAERESIQKEREELERQQKLAKQEELRLLNIEIEAKKKALEAELESKRKIFEAQEQERLKKENEERLKREEIEKQERIVREQKEAQELKIRQEQERIAKIESDKKAAIEAKKQKKLDGIKLLDLFLSKYENDIEFVEVVKAIKIFRGAK